MTPIVKTDRHAARPGTGIFCGTDLSANAQQAMRAAGAIAGRLKEPVHLIHAIDLPGMGPPQAKELRWLTASRKRTLRQEAKTLRAAGVVVEERAPAGQPYEVLAGLASEERPRLVVIASRGHRGVERWFLGSVSERTAERSPIPAMVVRDAEPLVAWAGGQRPLKVFVCFNYTLTSEAALQWAGELAAIGPCDLVIGYVNQTADEWLRLDGTGPVPWDGNPSAVQSLLEREVRVRAAAVLGRASFRVRVEASREQLETQLAAMAEREQADLLVVGSHQYRGFERVWRTSISRGLLQRAVMNVAVVPRATEPSRPVEMAPPMRQVLACTDFSESANAAIPHAYSLLSGGGLVHLIHVVPSGPEPRGAGSAPIPTGADAQVQSCLAKLRALTPVDAPSRRIFTQAEVVENRDVAEGICRMADQLGVDAICLASHGRTGLVREFLGSVAQKVIALSRRPLFLVRPSPP